MIQRTHDLAAVALVSFRFLVAPPQVMTWETLVGIGVFTILGGMIADIDNVASPAWRHRLLPWDSKSTRDFLQGHRNVSHSIIGLLLFSFLVGILLDLVSLSNLDHRIIQEAFFLGHLSHLLSDSLTIQGVPWFYPIPFKFGFPPFSFLRVRTGGWVEKLLVFPGFLALTIWMYINYHTVVIDIFHKIKE